MMEFEVSLNLCFVAIILFWSVYRAHITEKTGSRFGYSAITLACLISIMSAFIKDDLSLLRYKGISWQTLFFHFTIAVYSCINLWQHHLTGELKRAFTHKRRDLRELADKETSLSPPPPPSNRPSPASIIK